MIDIILNLLHPQKGSIVLNNKYNIDVSNGGDYFTSILRSQTLLLGQNDFYTGDRIKDLLEINFEDIQNYDLSDKLNYGLTLLNLKVFFREEN